MAEPKICKITDHSALAIAGGGQIGHAFANYATARFAAEGAPRTSEELAQALMERYVEARITGVELEVFKVRGLTINGFYGGVNKDTAPAVAMQLDKEAKEYQFAFEFILGSVDGSGGHVHGVGNPGKVFYYDAVGFAVVGQGQLVERLAMIAARHDATKGLLETIYNAYAAARRSGTVTGVGLGVDVAIIRQEGVTQLTESQLEQLSAVYEESEKEARKAREAGMARIGIALFPDGASS